MKRAHFVLAFGVFLFLGLRPAYTVLLRRHLARALPQAWSAEPMNGRFAWLVPELIGTRYHDEALTAARVNQILIHGKPYNPYWREERSAQSWLHQSLTMYVLAAFALICGGNLNLAWIVALGALAAFWFLFLRGAFFWWTDREEISIPLALCWALFGPNFRGPLSDAVSLPLLALLLLGAWKLLGRAKDGAGACFALGLGFGAMALVQNYAHILGLAALGGVSAVVWWRNEHGNARRNAPWLLGGALTGTAAYGWVMAWALDQQTLRESLEFSGLAHSRHFLWISLVNLALAFFGFWRLSRESDKAHARRLAWLLLAIAQLAVFACANAQVVTGVMIGPAGFLPFGRLAGVLMLFLWLSEALSREAWWDRRMAWAASIAVCLLAVSHEMSAAQRSYRMLGLPKPTQEALDWINHHVEKDGLVMSLSAEADETIPIYTGAKVQAGPPDATAASPFTREVYYRRVAGLLKTVQADPGLFLRDRWLTGEAKKAWLGRIRREQRLLGRVDLDALEPALWFTPTFAWEGSDDMIHDGKLRIVELYRIIKPQPKPFYLWIGRGDDSYFTKTPEQLGGRLVYMNSAVKLYAF